MNQTTESRPIELWDIVDAALVINLDRRIDRWDRVRAHLQDIVPPDKLHRVSAVPGKEIEGYQTARWFRRTRRPETWAGRAGCSVSHRNAMRLALDRGWNWVLMIEDDARFVRSLETVDGRELAAFLQTRGEEFGVVYLGFDSPKRPIRRLQSLGTVTSLYQIAGCSTTHAYLVNSRVMLRLLQEFPQSEDDIWDWTATNVVIDRWYSLNLRRWTGVAAVSPQFAIQERSVSDITQRTSDYNEHPDADVLKPLSVTDCVWHCSSLLRTLVRPVTSIPAEIKAWLRKTFGF